jgi:acetoin utilization protein AcuB
MNISEIMTTDVVTVGPDDSLDIAIGLFEKHRLRHLPVVSRGALLSLLSEREVSLATGWRSFAQRKAKGQRGPRDVREIMRDRVVTLGPDHRVEAAASMMIGKRVEAIPILRDGILAGLVTTQDVLGAFRRRNPNAEWGVDAGVKVADYMKSGLETLSPQQDLSVAAGLCRRTQARLLAITDGRAIVGLISERELRFELGGEETGDSTPLSGVMTTELVTVRPDEDLSVAADSMLEHQLSALPVVEDEALVGMLTDADIIQHCTSRRRL